MESNLKEKINEMSQSEDGIKELTEFLELPDEKFDAVYPTFKVNFKKVCESVDFQHQIMAKVQLMPAIDIEAERQGIEDFLSDINEEEALSANKKEMISLMFHSVLDVIQQVVDSNREQISVKIVKLNPAAELPKYAHPTDAGADIKALEDTIIKPNETVVVKTGLAVAIPAGYEIQVRPRSGISLNTPLRIANTVGTIDSSYRGEIGIIMTNTGTEPYTIERGTKIAQILIAPTPMIKWEEVGKVEELGETNRGAGGFGSTGN